jgi:hypothetical protein
MEIKKHEPGAKFYFQIILFYNISSKKAPLRS